jgi:hypothetical protein
MRMHSTLLVFFASLAIISGATCIAAEPKEVQHGLKMEIFGDTQFRSQLVERIDPNIDSYWDYGSPDPKVPIDNFSIRWTGWIRAPKAGRYKLITHSDDGVVLRLNGNIVINRTAVGQFTEEANVELSETPTPISLSYQEFWGPTWCVLNWQPVGAPASSPIPAEAFFPTEESLDAKAEWKPSDKQGLVAEYFDKTFSRRLRTDRAVRMEAIWGDGAPLIGLPVDAGARYSGYLVPEVTGQYKFVCVSNDHTRLWIDGKPILEAKFGQPKATTAVVELEAKKPYAIRVEYVDVAAWASYSLQWVRPFETQVTSIPSRVLFQSKAAIPKP